MNKSQNKNVIFHSHRMHLSTLFEPFLQTEMIDFPTFSYSSASKSPPFYIHEAQIRYSFWAEPPRIGQCGEYPPPPLTPGVRFKNISLNLNKSLNIHKETVSYRTLIVPIKVNQLPSWEHGWRSGESTHLPAMWPGFKSRRRRHIWVEFVVGALPCSERFFSGFSSFPLSSKINIFKFQFAQESGRRRTTMWMCYLQIVIYSLYLFIYLFKLSLLENIFE